MYVGQTSRSLAGRLSEHKNHPDKKNYVIASAIKKYGMAVFETSVLATAHTQEHLNNLERLWIVLLRSSDRNYGYNVASGGRYNFHSESTRLKISQTMKAKGIKPAAHIRMAGNVANRGLRRSPEVIQKLSLAKKGKPSPKKGIPSGVIPWNKGIRWKRKKNRD